jgi:CubicO group peptidase (beta-lactamase class C family)/D-alanyl-D-alanine dipeptidase
MARYGLSALLALAVAASSALLMRTANYSCGDERSNAAKAYEPAVRALHAFIARELANKHLPALSIALVDDQTIVWAKGYGFSDSSAKVAATTDTVYRAGSVSKLFSDIAVMQLVEEGKLDLDVPVTRYLPDFKPANPFGRPITLRQLMAHRSGLVREPPVGNYFDPSPPSLAKVVESLNQTELVYEPETRTKYSNAAITTVGYVLERTQNEPFARYLKRRLLEPMGMTRSGFEPTPALMHDLAAATMWTYWGREFPAPTFELGMAPAGSMYSTANDLGRFLSMLFNGGRSSKGPILKPETLEKMWTPQFDKKGDFGIGFHLGQLEGRRRIGHGGAIYGFATELAALPSDKLGVVVVTARDCANAVTTHIADVALRHMLAVRQGKSLPKIEETTRLKPETARRLAGRYRSDRKGFDLLERGGTLCLLPLSGGMRMEVRALADALVVDDRLGYGTKIIPEGDKLRVGDTVLERVAIPRPPPPPAGWRGLIGEYGWDHNTLYILEKDGKLQALIEWFFLYPLEQESADVFKFPEFGLYHGEKLIFKRDQDGRAASVEAAKVVFPRRQVDGENGATFRIQPQRPLADLRREAHAAVPPKESGNFRPPDLVEVTKLDDTVRHDVRYAGTNNFLSTPFYSSSKVYLQRPAAEALVRVHQKLAVDGYGLLLHDGYRPWYVTKMFWEATPPKQRVFVADPAQGSRHNRGCAIDLTLYDRKNNKPVEMTGGYDEFSDRSYPDYLGGTSEQRWLRDLLRRAMEAEGFSVYEAEWWHFDYKDWKSYPILNLTFEQLAAQERMK